jgi:RimJ/RimL family protein N-acetyltransferase
MNLIPELKTERLELRAMRKEDFDQFAHIWASPDVVRYIGKPKKRFEAWQSFLSIAGHWQMHGIGQWAIVEQSSQKMIGHTGFFFAKRGLGVDFDECLEAGWVLATEAQGKGYGPEAAAATHDWLDQNRPGPLVAVMSKANAASRHMADSLGYEVLRWAELTGDPVLLLHRKSPVAPA